MGGGRVLDHAEANEVDRYRAGARNPMPTTTSPSGASHAPTTTIVVGNGIVGATTALFLAREGLQVTLVDRYHAGRGPSGRNAGYVSMITRSGGPQLDLANLSREIYPRLAEDLDDFEFEANGALVYYFEEQLPLIHGFVERRQADGRDMEIVDGNRARELCPLLPEDVAGGIH